MRLIKIARVLQCVTCLIILSYAEEVCQEIELSGAVNHASATGTYYYASDVHCNSRPVWADAARRNYVYYLLDGYDGWMVSAESCYVWGNFKLKARSGAAAPYEITKGNWSEYSPEKALWEKSESFQIKCVNKSNSKTTVLPSLASTSRIKQGSPFLGSMCAVVQCMENSDCIPDEKIGYRCVCRVGYEYNGVACKSIQVYWNRILITSIIAVGVTALLCGLVCIFYCNRCWCHKSAGKREEKPCSPRRDIFKYRPLEEEVTGHPA